MKSLSRNRPALSRRFYELNEFGVFKNEIFNSNALIVSILIATVFSEKIAAMKFFGTKQKKNGKKV